MNRRGLISDIRTDSGITVNKDLSSLPPVSSHVDQHPDLIAGDRGTTLNTATGANHQLAPPVMEGPYTSAINAKMQDTFEKAPPITDYDRQEVQDMLRKLDGLLERNQNVKPN